MLTALLPHFSYRRLCARTLVNVVRGKASLQPSLDSENWHYYRTYARRQFKCNVCEHSGRPFFDFPDLRLRREHRIGMLRETMQCRACGATIRHRALATAMLEIASSAAGRVFGSIKEAAEAGFGQLQVLDSDNFSPIAKILRRLPNYLVSSFRPELEFDKEIEPGHYNVNLERMGFADASFDMVITSDVMEHVRSDGAAHAEIARVLRPNGNYVFTVPYDDACADQHLLVDTSGSQDVFLVPPQMHGDPISGGILAYRVYGRSLFRQLDAVGLDARFRVVNDSDALIVHGDVFTATRR